MLENLSNIIIIASAVVGAIAAALFGGLTVWAFRDIRSRSRDILVQILATVMVALIPIAGILVYLMLRPRETLQDQYVRALEEESLLSAIEHQEFCPSCTRRVDDEMRFCPSCHTKLRNDCPNCGKAVHLSWDLCPYCGNGLRPEAPTVTKASIRQTQVPAPKPQPPRQTTLPEPAVRQVPPARPVSAPVAQPADILIQDPVSPRTVVMPPVGNPTRTNGLTGILDKLGGAVEGVVNKVSSAKPAGKPEELE